MTTPELDLKKVNLQSAVAYLISLHDNEVDWNLLGIKVIGHIDALPIPAGEYEYGDAYMVGTETPYDMYIYTRPDGEVHKEGYWFPLGKFPVPGPQGPKGDGIGQVQLFQEGLTTNLTYDTSTGCKNNSLSTMSYVDSTTGQRLTQTFQMTSRIPFTPGKYINMDATEDNKKVEIKVDASQLNLDYYKISKGSTANVPAYSPTSGIIALPYSYQNTGSSLVRRGAEGEAKFTYGIFGRWNDINSGNLLDFNQLWRQCGDGAGYVYVAKTTTDTGTISADNLNTLRHMPKTTIVYNSQEYYRMDPASAPDGTLNYIHIDAVQDGNGGYKATGKCFSITVSTRSFQVVDVTFSNATSPRVYRHHISYNFNISGTNYNAEFDLFSNSVASLTYDEINIQIPLLAPMNVTIVDTGSHKYGAGQLAKVGTSLHLYGAVGTQNIDLTPTTSTTVWLDTVVQVG